MEMDNDSFPWPRPLCLVKNIAGSSSSMVLNEDTVAKLEQIKEPVVVISVVGPYRSGKSYLMNRLANRQSGFDLGNTVQAKTKGIWIWCVAHPTKPDYRLLLMDTEGLEDVEKGDAKNDAMLFLIAALLSGTLVYNTRGAIDQTAIKKLQHVIWHAEKIQMVKTSESLDDDDRALCAYLPTFVWAIRDFTLELKIDGKQVTADEYLEHGLKPKQGSGPKIMEYNLPRSCIKSYFPNRKCFVFSFPTADPALMSKLGGQMDMVSPRPLPGDSQRPESLVDDNKLVPAFLERLKEFCDYIYAKSEPKCIFGAAMDGTKFTKLAKHYIDIIASGGIVCIVDSFVATAEAVNRTVLERCVAHYVNAMSKLELPTVDENTLREHDTRCTQQVTAIFRKEIMVINGNKLDEKLAAAITEKFKEISECNEMKSAEKCRKIMEKEFEHIENKMCEGFYLRKGGYSDYQADLNAAYKAYKETPGKGVKATAIERIYVTKYSDIGAKSIMVADKKFTEQERKNEEQRVRLDAMRLDVEELKREKAISEQRSIDQERRMNEFKRAMEEKFDEQTRLHQEQMNQLIERLSQREVDDDAPTSVIGTLRRIFARFFS